MEDGTKQVMAGDEPVIICREMNKWFGDFHVLRNLSLEVMPQEVLVIIGPSGSGKSTFIRCINRLEEHQDGQIIVDGIELSHDVQNIADIRRGNWHGFPAIQSLPAFDGYGQCFVGADEGAALGARQSGTARDGTAGARGYS